MNAIDPATVFFQLIAPLVLSLAFGPWMTLAGLRVLRSRSQVQRRSMMNDLIRMCARSPLGEGSVRRGAWMILVGGILVDIVAILMLAELLELVLAWLAA